MDCSVLRAKGGILRELLNLRKFAFCSKDNGKILKGFKRSDIMHCEILIQYLGCRGGQRANAARQEQQLLVC